MPFYFIVEMNTELNSCVIKDAWKFLIEIVPPVPRIMEVGSFSTPFPTVVELEAESLYDREDSHHKTSLKAWKLHYRKSALLVNLSRNSSQDLASFLLPSGPKDYLFVSFFPNCYGPFLFPPVKHNY